MAAKSPDHKRRASLMGAALKVDEDPTKKPAAEEFKRPVLEEGAEENNDLPLTAEGEKWNLRKKHTGRYTLFQNTERILELAKQKRERGTSTDGQYDRDDDDLMGREFVEHFGIGISLYFKGLKYLVFVFGILTILSIPSVVIFLAGGELDSSDTNLLTRTTMANMPNLNVANLTAEPTLWGVPQADLFVALGWLDFAAAAFYLGATAFLAFLQEREVAALDVVHTTLSDYTLWVRRLPCEEGVSAAVLRGQLRRFFEDLAKRLAAGDPRFGGGGGGGGGPMAGWAFDAAVSEVHVHVEAADVIELETQLGAVRPREARLAFYQLMLQNLRDKLDLELSQPAASCAGRCLAHPLRRLRRAWVQWRLGRVHRHWRRVADAGVKLVEKDQRRLAELYLARGQGRRTPRRFYTPKGLRKGFVFGGGKATQQESPSAATEGGGGPPEGVAAAAGEEGKEDAPGEGAATAAAATTEDEGGEDHEEELKKAVAALSSARGGGMARRPVCAFVTFRDDRAAGAVEEWYRSGPRWAMRHWDRCGLSRAVPELEAGGDPDVGRGAPLCCWDPRALFHGRRLRVDRAPEPEDLKWEDLEATGPARWARYAATVAVTLLLLGCTFGMVAILEDLSSQLTLSTESCAAEGNYIDEPHTSFSEDELECWCSYQDYFDIWLEDYCSDYVQDYIAYTLFGYLFVFTIEGLNILLESALERTSEREPHNLRSFAESFLVLKVSFAQVVNTAIVIVFLYAVNDASSYGDFTAPWYTDVGTVLLVAMMFNVFVPQAEPFLQRLTRPCVRWLRRGRCVTQADLEALYAAPEFRLTARNSLLLTTVTICLIFAPGLPLLYPTAMVTFLSMYWVDKYHLLRFYARPAPADHQQARTLAWAMQWAVVPHLVVAIYQFGYQDITFVEAVGLAKATGGPARASTEATWMLTALLAAACFALGARLVGLGHLLQLIQRWVFCNVCGLKSLRSKEENLPFEEFVAPHRARAAASLAPSAAASPRPSAVLAAGLDAAARTALGASSEDGEKEEEEGDAAAGSDGKGAAEEGVAVEGVEVEDKENSWEGAGEGAMGVGWEAAAGRRRPRDGSAAAVDAAARLVPSYHVLDNPVYRERFGLTRDRIDRGLAGHTLAFFDAMRAGEGSADVPQQSAVVGEEKV